IRQPDAVDGHDGQHPLATLRDGALLRGASAMKRIFNSEFLMLNWKRRAPGAMGKYSCPWSSAYENSGVWNSAFRIKNSEFTSRRRGTILIFTLGILTLLALVGIGLLANMRSERLRVDRRREVLAEPSLLDGVVRSVQERLRADMWSPVTT